jgi:hypothetical protein
LAVAQHLPRGRHQAGDRHLIKIHEDRDNLVTTYVQDLSISDIQDQERAFDMVTKRALLEPVLLNRDAAKTLSDEVDGGRSLQFTVKIPFTGAPELLRTRPSSFTMSPPPGSVGGGFVEFGATFPSTVDQDSVKAWRRKIVEDIDKWLVSANHDAEAHNEVVKAAARSEYRRRLENLVRMNQLDEELGAGI